MYIKIKELHPETHVLEGATLKSATLNLTLLGGYQGIREYIIGII